LPNDRRSGALPEIAIAGRSNVGKSSLLNAIGRRRDLARVSKTPGRTQRLHFFREREKGFVLVDLPGFGYARASKQVRRQLSLDTDSYLQQRQALRALVLLLDVRRDPESEEHGLADFASSRGVDVLRVATKVDKLGRVERQRRLRVLESAGLGPWLPFSAVSGEGRDVLIAALTRLVGPRTSSEPSGLGT
jgi:GTP-binding protein